MNQPSYAEMNESLRLINESLEQEATWTVHDKENRVAELHYARANILAAITKAARGGRVSDSPKNGVEI